MVEITPFQLNSFKYIRTRERMKQEKIGDCAMIVTEGRVAPEQTIRLFSFRMRSFRVMHDWAS